jgi:hypothetical protein
LEVSAPTFVLVAAGFFLAIAVLEELIFRGYLLGNAAEGATIVLDNRHAVMLAVGVSAAPFGLLLGGVYLCTESLALPIGLHTGWNFALGPIFGLPVSGLTSSVALVAVQSGSQTRLTGGKFGPEAGLIAVGALVTGGGLLAFWLWAGGKLSIYEQIAEPDLWTRS